MDFISCLQIENVKSKCCFVQSLSCVQLFVTLWTAACQASLSSTISQSLFKFKAQLGKVAIDQGIEMRRFWVRTWVC